MANIKICGVTTPDILNLIGTLNVSFVGFVFVQQSPRALSLNIAETLAYQTPQHIQKIGLFCNPDDDILISTLDHVPLDGIQLHGTESPSRVHQIKSRFLKPVIKAIPISVPSDLPTIREYESIADWILLDSKPPQNSTITGGHGVSFDWNILKGYQFQKPWMLSGGLNPDNVAQAISLLQPDAVDVSSGVELTRGIKDAQKIKDFVQSVSNSNLL